MKNDRRKARRDIGGRRREDEFGIRSALYIAGIILALGIIAFFVTVMIYNNRLDKVYSDLDSQEIAQTEKNNNIVEEASMEIGRSIQEIQEGEPDELELGEGENPNTANTNETVESGNNTQTQGNSASEENRQKSTAPETTKVEEPVKDPEFILPVEGTLMREYAKDNLVYSETLKEWVIHTGIDIKADKTTVVKAAEAGKVTAIKNDPRYGITVIIEHANGFETRYANLLTAEFVTVGEEVTKGQTIGTVGNTATFEILDDSHLHFEILKNGEYQAPELFIEI